MFRTLALLLATACASPALQVSTQQPLQMRTWDLPPGQAARLSDPLNRMFGEQLPGRALEGPGGALVVAASPAVLDSVEALVGKLDKAPTIASPDVLLDYWVVKGIAATEASAGSGLSVLAPVLDEVQKVDGPMALSLEAKRQLRTRQGERGESNGEVTVRQMASTNADDGRIVADVYVEIEHEAEFDTRLSLRAGEFAILSQATYSDEPAWMYIIVRPTTIE